MKDLTQGPVLRQLLGLSGFMMIGMVVQTLYGLIDLYWVGSLGPRAVAAVTLASNTMFASMALSQMLGVGTAALVAQAIGRKDHEAAHAVFNQAMGIALLAMLAFGVVGWAGEAAYARAFAPDAETAAMVAGYLRWFIPGMALQLPMMVMGAALRGTGDMLPGTVMQIGTVLLNIVFAPLLIFGWAGFPQMGVAGAGLATLLAIVCGALGLAWYFARPQTFLRMRPRQWRAQPAAWIRIMRIGLPSAAEFALLGCYMVFVTAVLRPFGPEQQAAFGIGQRLIQMAMLPVMALSFATATVVGQNYGAGLFGRVRETFFAALKVGIAGMVLFVILFETFPAALVSGFTKDPVAISAGVDFLRFISVNLLSTAIVFACFGVLSGLGNTLPTLISSATRIALIVIPASLLSRHGDFKVSWIWELSVASTLVQMLMNLWFLRRELRLRLDAPPAAALAATTN